MRYLVPALLLVVAGGLLLLRGFAAEKPATDKPTSALILIHKRGSGVVTHRLTDARKVEELEAFFPGYRDRPGSDTAAGWKLGYEVYFDIGDGRSTRVAVSPPSSDISVWTMNHGDLAIKGDFHKFVADLAPPAKGETAIPMPAAWGKATNGLSGRLTVVPEELQTSRRHVVSVELKNDSSTPFAVINQPRLEAELTTDAKLVFEDGVHIVSGPVPNPQWGVVPQNASLGFRVDKTTVHGPNNGSRLLAIGDKIWDLMPGTYELRVVLVTEKSNDGPDNQWVGRLTLPPVVIVVAKPSSK